MLDSILSDRYTITLNHDENTFGFRFASLHFASPKHNKIRYRLKGLNDCWTEMAISEKSVIYANVSAGKYVFELMAADHYGNLASQ